MLTTLAHLTGPDAVGFVAVFVLGCIVGGITVAGILGRSLRSPRR